MKKILCLIAAIACILSFASCENSTATLNGKTPYEVYTAAQAYIENHMDVCVETIKNTSKMKMSYGGKSHDVNYSATSTNVYNSANGEKYMYSKDTTDIEIVGVTTQSESSELWFIGDELYEIVDGEKMCVKGLSYDQFLTALYSIMGVDQDEATLMNVPESWMKGVSFKSNGETFYYEVEMDPDELDGGYEKLLETILGGSLGSADVKSDVESYKIEVHFDKSGNLEMYKAIVKGTFDIGGIVIEIDGVEEVTYDFDNVPAVTAPADKAEYVDITEEFKALIGISG